MGSESIWCLHCAKNAFQIFPKNGALLGWLLANVHIHVSQTSLTSEGLGGEFWWSLPYAMLFYANSVAMCGLLSSFHHAKATTFSHFAQCLINDDLSCNGVASRKPQGWPYQCTTGYGQLGALLWSSLFVSFTIFNHKFPAWACRKVGGWRPKLPIFIGTMMITKIFP